ncbi:MAG: hypothetical protein KGL39_26635 [Patescibacteria group bacterium]|nr:hypothetical protein [Patescibacteria group bacterium]
MSVALADRVDEIVGGVSPEFAKLIDTTKLQAVLKQIDKTGDTIEPPAELIYEFLRYFDLPDTKGVLLAQDPYPNDAIGICFATRATSKLPGSFKNIISCLESKGLMKPLASGARHADIRPWVVQGLLCLNMALTTKKGKPGEHKQIWRDFVVELLERICAALPRKVFFLLWGSDAKKFKAMAKKHGHAVFEYGHPSPVNTSCQFINCPNFESANEFLKSKGEKPFVWDNMARVIAYTDGACTGNGKSDPAGGFGVVIVGGHFAGLRASGAVPPFQFALVDESHPDAGFAATDQNAPATNNRAELLASCWALLILIRGYAFGDVELVSDSKMCVEMFEQWLPNRKKGGTEADLENRDLIVIFDALLGRLRERANTVKLRRVRAAHNYKLPAGTVGMKKLDWHGNNDADSLAKAAAESQAPLEIRTRIPILAALAT